MLAAIQGDERSYRALLMDLAPAVRSAATRGFARYGVGSGDVEDVVQETLLSIHLKRHTWHVGAPVAPWVMAIARNKLIDALRRRGSRIQVPIDDVLHLLETEPVVEASLDRADVGRLLDRLPERQRAIVRAVSLEGESMRVVAERFGMSEVAVRVALHRALKALAKLYRDGTT